MVFQLVLKMSKQVLCFTTFLVSLLWFDLHLEAKWVLTFHLYLLDHNVDQLKSIFQLVVGVLGGLCGPFLYVCSCGFLKHIWLKCPVFLQYLHWCLLTGHLKPCMCGVSPHLIHLSFVFVCSCLNFLFACGILSFVLSYRWCSCWFLELDCLGLNFLCFLWNLLFGSSVYWCLIRLTFPASGLRKTCLIVLQLI